MLNTFFMFFQVRGRVITKGCFLTEFFTEKKANNIVVEHTWPDGKG